MIVDAGQPVALFDGSAAGTVTFGATAAGAVSGFGLASFAGGTMFDVSACDAWSLYGQVLAGGTAPGAIRLHYFADVNSSLHDGSAVPPASVSEIQHLQLPTGAQQVASGAFMLAGRTLGPVVAIELDCAGGTYHVEFFAHNRTRIYDTPYTPGLLGSILAAIPAQSVGAAGHVTVALPYYLGPANLNLLSNPTAGCAARVRDNSSGTELASVPFGSTELWLPNFVTPANASTWELRLDNFSAGAIAAGATVTAA